VQIGIAGREEHRPGVKRRRLLETALLQRERCRIAQRGVVAYVSYHQNVPTLVQLMLWYFGISSLLPDALQGGKNTSPVALRYTWDDSDEAAMNYSPAKGMGKSPVFKAMPKQQPMLRTVTYAIWGQGFGDIEWRSGSFNGADIGRTTTTAGGIGGADVTVTNVFSATDAIVLGALGGFTSARVKNADGSTATVDGPGVGAYAIYVNGGFSTDAQSCGAMKAGMVSIRFASTRLAGALSSRERRSPPIETSSSSGPPPWFPMCRQPRSPNRWGRRLTRF